MESVTNKKNTKTSLAAKEKEKKNDQRKKRLAEAKRKKEDQGGVDITKKMCGGTHRRRADVCAHGSKQDLLQRSQMVLDEPSNFSNYQLLDRSVNNSGRNSVLTRTN